MIAITVLSKLMFVCCVCVYVCMCVCVLVYVSTGTNLDINIEYNGEPLILYIILYIYVKNVVDSLFSVYVYKNEKTFKK